MLIGLKEVSQVFVWSIQVNLLYITLLKPLANLLEQIHYGGGKQYSLATRGVNNLRVSIEIPKTSNFIPGRYTLGLNAGLVMN